MAYGEAAKRLPPNAIVYTEWAEAVAQSQGQTLGGLPTELLDKALAVDPGYQKALALAGSAALERNDRATAGRGGGGRIRPALLFGLRWQKSGRNFCAQKPNLHQGLN